MARKRGSALKSFTAKARRGPRAVAKAGGRRGRGRFRATARINRHRAKGSAPSRSGGFKFMGVDVVGSVITGVTVGAGAALSGYGTNLIAAKLNQPQLQSGAGKHLLKAGVNILGTILARRLPAKFRGAAITGMWGGLGLDLLNEYVLPKLPIPALSGFEPLEQQLAAALEDGSGMQGLVAIDTARSPLGALPLSFEQATAA